MPKHRPDPTFVLGKRNSARPASHEIENVFESGRDMGLGQEGGVAMGALRRAVAGSGVLLVGLVVVIGWTSQSQESTTQGLDPSLSAINQVDESIFRLLIRPHLADGENHPWVISATMIPVTEGTPKADIAYLKRWEAIAMAFARLTFEPTEPGFDADVAASVRAASVEAFERLGSRPNACDFRTVGADLLRQHGVLQRLIAEADRGGSLHVDTIPDWALSDDRESCDQARPAVTVSPALPNPRFGCEALFFYCPNTRSVRLQTLEGPSNIGQCLEKHRELLGSDRQYSGRFERTMNALATKIQTVDPASTRSIVGFTEELYATLEESGVAFQLQGAVDSRKTRQTVQERRVP